MMIVNVVDVESTCWENDNFRPTDQRSEIIEIGITALDLSTGKMNSESLIVLPEYSKVSDFCTELTGHTIENLQAFGKSFRFQCSYLEKMFDSKNRMWLSWGDYDRKQFKDRDCVNKGVVYPFGYTHFNLKMMFSLLTGRKGCGMMKALNIMGIKHEGIHHSGIDDSRNIAKILMGLRTKL